MKKILALLVAILMLFSAAAMAEGSAGVLTVSNIRMQSGGQNVSIGDLSASLVLENVNNLPSVALLVDGDSQPLVTAVAQLTSKQFNFAIDGMGHGYTADIPAEQAAQLAQVGDAGLAVLVPTILPGLDSVVLPPFTGVDIPKLDMSQFLGAFMTGDSTFEIPYEQVNELLDTILQLAKTQGSNVKDLDEAIEMLEQLKASGTGIAIKGDIADDGTTQTVTADVYLAQNGTVSDQEMLRIIVTSRQNNFSVAVATSENGASTTVLTAALESDPASATLTVNLDVMGEAGMTFSLYPDGGLQKAALNVDGGSDSARAYLEFAYGQQDGSDIVSFGGEADGTKTSFLISTVKGSDGTRSGSFSLDVTNHGEVTALSGDITMYVGDEIDLNGFVMPSDLRPFEQMDTEAISKAFEPAVDYISSHGSFD